MRFIYLFLSVFLIGTLILSGCQTNTSSAFPSSSPSQLTYTDDLSRVVQIKGLPRRIVSMSPSNTEILFALGLGDRVVGVTSYDNYPPEASQKTIIGGFSDPDIEKIVALSPDLILADALLHASTIIPALEKLGLPVIAVRPAGLDQVVKNITTVSEVTGDTKNAEVLISSMQKRISAITEKTHNLVAADKPRVFYLTWYDPLWTAGNNTIIDEMITKSGGTNIASDLKDYATITLESVVERNPQIILVMSSMGDQETAVNYVKSEPRFQVIDALKNNKVFVVDADIFGRTSPRIINGFEQMAKMIHPEIFP